MSTSQVDLKLNDTIKLVKTSPLSGKTNSMTITLNMYDFEVLYKQHKLPIQEAMPYLNSDEREFIMTGIIPSEWDNFFKN